VAAVLRALDEGTAAQPEAQRAAARYLLYLLADRHPGRVLEVRIPPVAAVQCLPGPVHTRGTPPNVVETDPVTWIRLATGRLGWAEAIGSGAVHASGPRADLASYLPLT
jgi:Bacterial SCP ortholog